MAEAQPAGFRAFGVWLGQLWREVHPAAGAEALAA